MKPIYLILITSMFVLSAKGQHHHEHKTDTTKKSTKPAVKPPAKKSTAPKQVEDKKDSHAGHDHGTTKDTIPKKKSDGHEKHDHAVEGNKAPTDQHTGHDHSKEEHDHGGHGMSHAFSRNLSMNRNGSGTAWLPDNSPMFGYMFHTNKWMYMIHGNLFLRFNKQDLFDRGSRGDKKFDAPNMWMIMGQRNVGHKGLFHFSTMFSLDPLTVGESGYPLLFQTGETYKGKPLIDRQHPHDLISEISVSYAHAFNKNSDIFLYLGYPGEPALGPAAFVHRPSGFMNPDAPLTHHWVDATHITFGVATLGYRYGKWKIEGSSFTGREPDENRYNFDKPRFDSWSGRLSFNPSHKWSMQLSHGFIKQPEVLHPDEDVNRTTASVQYSKRGFGETFKNITALWGMNKTKDHHGEHGVLLEGSLQRKRVAWYTRYEFVQKSLEELGLDESEFGHDAIFPIHALTGGLSYDLFKIRNTRIAAGGQFTFFNPDKRLTKLYGDNPVAGQLYLRIYPKVMGQRMGVFSLPY